MDIGTDDGIDYTFSGLGHAFFNMAFLAGRHLDAAALAAGAARAMAHASPRNVPWFLVVTEERLAPGVNAAAVLEGEGLVPAMPLTGMVADTPSRQPPCPHPRTSTSSWRETTRRARR